MFCGSISQAITLAQPASSFPCTFVVVTVVVFAAAVDSSTVSGTEFI
jgi:hypothetical protein